jgi:hypothetical protein
MMIDGVYMAKRILKKRKNKTPQMGVLNVYHLKPYVKVPFCAYGVRILP